MKEIKVKEEFRTNPLSLQPGGSEVKLFCQDGVVFIYDNIKSPTNYISKVKFKDEIVRIDVDGKQVWTSSEPGVKYWDQTSTSSI
jgi:hypothetical protein